jgi:hypothetical protein
LTPPWNQPKATINRKSPKTTPGTARRPYTSTTARAKPAAGKIGLATPEGDPSIKPAPPNTA